MDANSLIMGSGSKSAQFAEPGATVTGTIASTPEVRQQTDLASGEPLTWPNGDPKMQVVVTLDTDLRDDAEDDGKRAVYIKGKSLTGAVRDAVRAAGAKGVEVGGTLTVTYTGDGVPSTKGFNPPKLYTAVYAPPSAAAANAALGLTAPEPKPAEAQVDAAAALASLTPEQRKALGLPPY